MGEVPTGSRDPYGIRRAANALISLILRKKLDVDLFVVIEDTVEFYPQLSEKMDSAAIKQFLVERLRHILRGNEYKLSHDIIEAVLAGPCGNFYRALLRATCLQEFQVIEKDRLAELVMAFTRIKNIAGNHISREFDPSIFDEAERKLWRAFLKAEGAIRERVKKGDYSVALLYMHDLLVNPINEYFDEVFVMHEDERIRNNRLSFLRSILDLFLEIGDLSVLSV